MQRNSVLAQELLGTMRRQVVLIDTSKKEVAESKKPRTSRGYQKPATEYDKYQGKLERGEFEKFNTRDLCFFFRDKAEENGYKYIVSDYKIEMRNFKLCISRGYDIKDIMVMIDFLYSSEQDYLDKKRLHPGILLTNWCNTIYADSQSWLDGSYSPKSKTSSKKSKRPVREWSEGVKDTTVKIGEW